ncbi:MAG: AAA family ATPase [Candidatus Magnetomorum sp.]|nr:AAA family ATPase [Candidatus Magnetomorum sp.]
MKSKINVYVFYASQKGKDIIDRCLQNAHYLELKGMEKKLERFKTRALQDQPDILIIENNPTDSSLMPVLEHLSHAGLKCIVFSESNNSDQILTAFRMGAREFLIEGPQLEQSFKDAIIRLTEQRLDPQNKKAHRIALIGAKGGVGVSHLSVNLAWTLSHTFHQQTLLVDLDTSGAKDAFMLDLTPEKTFLEFASKDSHTHLSMAYQLLTHVSPNFSLLPLPENPADIENITAEQVQTVLDNLDSHHDIILLDLSHHLHELTLLGMDSARSLLLLIDPTVISVKAGIQKIQLMEKMGYDRNNIHAVINRFDRKQALGPQQLVKTLGVPVFEWLPNDEKRLTQAENTGKPVYYTYPGCKYAKKIDQIADKLLETTT